MIKVRVCNPLPVVNPIIKNGMTMLQVQKYLTMSTNFPDDVVNAIIETLMKKETAVLELSGTVYHFIPVEDGT